MDGVLFDKAIHTSTVMRFSVPSVHNKGCSQG